MKRKMRIVSILIILIVLAVLFVPIPRTLRDGGTREYSALAYKYVVWHRINGTTTDENGNEIATFYQAKRVYWIPNSRKSIDELWEIEQSI